MFSLIGGVGNVKNETVFSVVSWLKDMGVRLFLSRQKVKHIDMDSQTRLLCFPKKPCLQCKIALFGNKRSLVFNGVAFSVRRDSRNVRLLTRFRT